MKRFTHFAIFWTVVISAGFCLSGCSSIAKSQQAKRTVAAERKEHYAALKADITNKTLHKDSPTTDLKARYGAPDDIMYSGSSVSSFQIWTYNVYKDKLADTKLDVVILYIENDKLVNWKY